VNVFTEPLPRKGNSSSDACISFPSRCLEMDMHVTIFLEFSHLVKAEIGVMKSALYQIILDVLSLILFTSVILGYNRFRFGNV
jgi:hypothetical protein